MPMRNVTAKGMLASTVLVGVLAAALFYADPNLDLAVARRLYLGNREFVGDQSGFVSLLRLCLNIFFWSICALALAGLVQTIRNHATWLTLPFRQWLYLAACLACGPGLVSNLVLKDHWGRARPHHVIEFGGTKEFTPPLTPTDQCDRNCSFVSGEASSTFIIFFAAALVLREQGLRLVVAGILAGAFSGFVRMLQGGHFFSDVIFAGIMMALTAACIQLLFDADEPQPECERR